jgi:hypothetical protein
MDQQTQPTFHIHTLWQAEAAHEGTVAALHPQVALLLAPLLHLCPALATDAEHAVGGDLKEGAGTHLR